MIPKIAHPICDIIQPSTKKVYKFRPYLVKEEKILLMAKQTGQAKDAYQAIKTILESCAQSNSFDSEMPLFDLEYMFLKLRAFSVNNIEKLGIRDSDDDKNYPLIVNFDEIEVNWPDPLPEKVVKIKGQRNKEILIKLKYPSADIYINKSNDEILEKLRKGDVFEFISCAIDSIYVGNDLAEMTQDELKQFIDTLDHSSFKSIEFFIMNLPSINYTISYTNSLDMKKNITFHSLMDFFFFV